jgi:zinc protease
MTFSSRIALLMAGLALACTAPAHAGLKLPKLFNHGDEAAKSAPAGVWPQARSDLKTDPAVLFGVLPNGMRYAIARSATPPGEASLRLRIDAGSLDETAADQGLAHFLEHMAFNGSKRVPEGEMIKILQRHGLAFGADTNASTSWTETVYQLDLPSTADETVDTGLMLLRETAGELTIDKAAVDRERGVVLSEERARAGPGLRVYKQGLGFVLKGQLAADRLPIGKVSVLQNATRDQIEAFYRNYYRPERTVLVAVGDFDPAAMEARIKARFSDWQGAGAVGPEPDLGLPIKRGPEVKLAVEPGAPLAIQVSWVRPPNDAPDTQARRKKDLLSQLGFAVLNRRLQTLARTGEPPFIGAYAYEDERFHSAELTTLAVSAEPAQWRTALTAVVQEQRRLAEYGVRQDELDREVNEYRSELVAQAAAAATRKTQQFADSIVDTIDDREVFTSPAQDLALFDEAVKGLKADRVSAAVKAEFEGQGPLVFVSSPVSIEGGEAVVTKAFAEAQGGAVAAGSRAEAKTWPYASFGKAGEVVERKEEADIGVTQVRFANGVRLSVKPTKFRDDQILVRARIGNGMLDLPTDRQTAMWAAGGAFTEGGLKDLTAEEIDRILSSRIYQAQFSTDDDAFELQGRTRPEDFDTQMQVLAAYASQPGFRTEAFQRMKTYASTIHDQMDATPGGVLGRDLQGLLHAGDKRFDFPSRAAIAEARPEQLRDLLGPLIADGEIEVVVVGDVTVDAAIKAVAQTFGALPPRKASAPSAAARSARLPPPSATPVVLEHKGRADQAMAYILWPGPDFFSDPKQARVLRLLAQVMELRLLDDIREKQGLSYSPQANATSSLVFNGYGYIAAAVEIPPDKADDFFASATKIAADLAARPVEADELDRARKPLLEGLLKARQSNEYWLEQLSGSQADPRRLEAVRSVVATIQAVTPEDLHRAAATWLVSAKTWKLEVKPGAGATAVAAD